jgi:hypothetical protein
MKIVQVILLLFLLTGCRDKAPTNSDNIQVPKGQKYKSLVEKMDKIQSTPHGNYFKFIPVNEKRFKIEWGNNKFKNESKTLYAYFTNVKLYLDWENEDFIVLRTDIIPNQGWLYYFLPLVPNGLETVLENPVGYNQDKNIVVSLGFKTDTVLLINNILTQEVQPVVETERCWNPVFFQRCIDSIKVADDFLYYTFQREKEKSGMNQRFKRKVKIKI